jgi:hypothetical protein
MLMDWELGVYFFRMRQEKATEQDALNAVRARFLDELCGRNKEPKFFMGTKYPLNLWLVLGVFWPPRDNQLVLPL